MSYCHWSKESCDYLIGYQWVCIWHGDFYWITPGELNVIEMWWMYVLGVGSQLLYLGLPINRIRPENARIHLQFLLTDYRSTSTCYRDIYLIPSQDLVLHHGRKNMQQWALVKVVLMETTGLALYWPTDVKGSTQETEVMREENAAVMGGELGLLWSAEKVMKFKSRIFR